MFKEGDTVKITNTDRWLNCKYLKGMKGFAIKIYSTNNDAMLYSKEISKLARQKGMSIHPSISLTGKSGRRDFKICKMLLLENKQVYRI